MEFHLGLAYLFTDSRNHQIPDSEGRISPPGTRIPSVRELAQEAAVNPNTMQRALALLKSEGLLITRRTTGRTVTEHQELIQLTRRTLAKDYIKQLSALDFSIEEINELMQEASKETT